MAHGEMNPMDHDGMTEGDGFCQGMGRVMNPGFVFSFNPTERTEGNSCILWLFKDAVVDTSGKYAAAVIGTFVLAFLLELLRASRGRMGKGQWPYEFMTTKASPLMADIILAGSYVIQMTLAYWLMLLVMLYEVMIFIAIVLGLGAGYVFVLRANRHLSQPMAVQKNLVTGESVEQAQPSEDDLGTTSRLGSVHDETLDTNSSCCNTAAFAA